jgi:pimeloyl-ACP methyl ester carboxylesterase
MNSNLISPLEKLTSEAEVGLNSIIVSDFCIPVDEFSVLHVKVMGKPEASPLVLLNTIAMPLAMVDQLARALAQSYRIFIWEIRGGPGSDTAFEPHYVEPSSQADELLAVARYFSFDRCAVIAWCSGVFSAVWSEATRKISFSKVVLISPSDIVSDVPYTEFQDKFLPLLQGSLTGSSGKAAMVRSFLARSRKPIASLTSVSIEETAQQIATRYLESDESYIRYASFMSGVLNFRKQLAPIFNDFSTRNSCLFIHAADDEYVDSNTSEKAAKINSKSKFILYPTGGHYLVLTKYQLLAEDIINYLES